MKKVILLSLLICLARSGYPAVLKGKVTDPQGNPVASVQVTAVEVTTRQEVVISTDVHGDFEQVVAGGSYAFFVRGNELELVPDLVLVKVAADEQRNLVFEVDGKQLTLTSSVSRKTSPGVAADQAPEPLEGDSSLAGIRDYQIQVARAESSRQNISSAEIVNPFPAQKSGRYHGSVYEFHRNDNFDARNFFDPVGERLPEYKRNQFGVTFSLALTKRMNLITNFEGLRIVQGSTLLSHVPTAEMKLGDFSGLDQQLTNPDTGAPFEANRIPESRIHPVSRKLLSLFPDPNRPDPDRNYVNSKPVVRNRNTLSFRFDHELAGGSNYVGRFWGSDSDDVNVNPLPTFGSTRTAGDKEVNFTHNHRFTTRLVGTVGLGYDRNTSTLVSVNAGRGGLLESLGIPDVSVADDDEQGYPDFRLSGYASFGDSGLPVTSTLNRFDFSGGLAYAPEGHSIRLGMGMSASQVNNNRSDGLRRGRFSFNGYYTGDAFADFLLGIPDTASRGVGSDRQDLRRKTWYVFARDDWKITQRLSLSGGLTYNYYQPFYSNHDNISGFYPLVLEPPLDGEIVTAGSERASELGLKRAGKGSLVFPDRNDFAPSFGMAYRPMGSNRLIFRSSYSVGYSPLGSGYYVSYMGRNFPFHYVLTAQSPVDSPTLDLSNPFATAVAAELSVRGIEARTRTAYIHYWQLGVQKEFRQQWNVEAWYLGSKGVHMTRTLAGNTPLPGPGLIQPRRPNPGYGRFNIVTGSGAYTRNALDLALERRLSNGLSIKSGFDWQLSVGDIFYGNPGNPRDLAAERARAEWVPLRHFSLHYIYDLPFGKSGRFGRSLGGLAQGLISGWRLSGITHFQDGYRFSVVSSGDRNNDGVSDDRPDRLGSGKLDSSLRSIDAWFVTSDFAEPPQYSYGNAGRNILVGPSYANWDISVIKQTRFADGDLVELRIELFNAFNKVNFELPSAVYGTSVFGKIFGAHRSREIEVALRYSF